MRRLCSASPKPSHYGQNRWFSKKDAALIFFKVMLFFILMISMLNRSFVYERGKHVINKVCLKSYVAITLIIMIKLIKLPQECF